MPIAKAGNEAKASFIVTTAMARPRQLTTISAPSTLASHVP
ncbi:hypothetical protein BAR24066_00848 [Burkholderia arboris]|uniref:Uncharacterized protein n=1 Tax=Burkholderia arboris TaxID=488730 RepID=A0A9Q9SES7_9BURK|nr:hypothetical protein BAR24066_00848 [Burkholderia arboris]